MKGGDLKMEQKKQNKCVINIKRDWIGRITRAKFKGCDLEQLEATLKKRNINLGDFNLIKKG